MSVQGLLDMIPKADGDSTLVGKRLLSDLPFVYRLWASLGVIHLKDWVQGSVPQSVFSLGNGLSSVEAWFSTALGGLCMSRSRTSLSRLIRLTSLFGIALLDALVCPLLEGLFRSS